MFQIVRPPPRGSRRSGPWWRAKRRHGDRLFEVRALPQSRRCLPCSPFHFGRYSKKLRLFSFFAIIVKSMLLQRGRFTFPELQQSSGQAVIGIIAVVGGPLLGGHPVIIIGFSPMIVGAHPV